jgi:hypothetical protein
MGIESLLFLLLPAALIGVVGFLVQSSLRDPRTVSWWRLAGSVLIAVGVCFRLGFLASVGGLGGVFAVILGLIATLPALGAGIWIAWSVPRWRKLVALLVLLIPTAFWISIEQGDAQSLEQITQRHGDQIVQALQAYHTAQRNYPAALSDLVPSYLPSLPDALTTQGTGWLYQSDIERYTLGYWYYPGKEVVMLCRYSSTKPSWDCGVTPNTQEGWAPFQVVWTPVAEP